MKKIILCLICVFFPGVLFCQLVEHPVFEYEYLSWRQHVDTVKKYLPDKRLLRPEQSSKSILKKPKEETFMLAYTDTAFAEIVTVGLQFTVKDSVLRLVQVSYIGIDPETKKQYDDIEDRLDLLTSQYTTHFGKSFEEKSIPFVGTIKSWEFVSSDVQMATLTSVLNLFIQFSPREE